ncbi:hypothetical protein GCM10028812_38350 [Ancylobacter sonchi]
MPRITSPNALPLAASSAAIAVDVRNLRRETPGGLEVSIGLPLVIAADPPVDQKGI